MKKLILSLIFFLILIITQAQIIEFTDINFKNNLLNSSPNIGIAKDINGNHIAIDSNSNGEIEVNEAEQVYELSLGSAGITSLEGINFFSNLTLLVCGWNDLSSLNLSGLNNLQSLDCAHNQLTSLDISMLTNLTTLNCISNQLTNINTTGLINLEFLYCSSNPLSSLNIIGLNNLTILECKNTSLTSLNISGLSNLTELYCENNFNLTNIEANNLPSLVHLALTSSQLINLDLTGMPNLNYLYCVGNNQLVNINLLGLTNLTNLQCFNNQLTNLDVSGLINLQNLDCSYNQLVSLEISGLNNLTYLDCRNNQLSNIFLSGLSNLESIYCHENLLSDLNFIGLSNLLSLDCRNNQLSNLDASSFTNLAALSCDENQLTNLDVSGCINLTSLYCSYNQLTSLDVSGLTNLINLDCSYNQITSLDISDAFYLQDLYCSDNNLLSIDVSNFNIIYVFDYGNNPNLLSICCNLENYVYISDYNQYYEYYNVSLNISGECEPLNKAFVEITYDADTNGCNVNDAALQNYTLNVTSSNQNTDFYFSNPTNYIYAIDDDITVTPLLENNYFTLTPASIEVTFEDGAPMQTLSFCYAPNGVHNDVEIAIIPIELARPGFDAYYKLIYKNKGTTTLSGDINLTFEEDYLDFVSANPTVVTQSAGNLSWNYIDLAPFESREILFTMNLNTPTDTNFPLNSGDILSFQALINPIQTDEYPYDNIATVRQEVVNSYDPNDKILLEGETILPEMVGEYVHYRIRFENEGTANAVNIRVEDTIDPTKFDISTLQVIDTSHSVRTIVEGNKVSFNFYNINLPFDDANNDGYIVFKIKTLETLQLNDTFSNQAEIYFDYNFPIITNNFVTTVSENLGVEDISTNSIELVLSPNPAHDSFTIQTKEVVQKVELYDANGRIVQSIINHNNQYNIAALAKGMYLVKVYTENGVEVKKLIKE